MIQDAAAKCRFCGEWLDPTKRPDWAGSAEAVPTPAPAAAPAPTPAPAVTPMGSPAPVVSRSPEGARALDPAATTTDGSLHRPRRRETQTWSAPAWMAHDDEAPAQPGPQATVAPTPDPKVADAIPPEIDDLLADEPEPEPARRSPSIELLATPAPAPEPVEHTIDEVAERMRRIKASAAAVREAMLRESEALQPDVLGDDEDAEAAVTMHAGAAPASAAPVADEPSPQPPPDVAAMLGDDFDDLDDDDDDDDLDLPAAAEPPKARKSARRSASDLDGLDDLDDAMPPGVAGGALAGFDFDDDDDDFGDDDDFDGDFGDVAASRPIPWKPVAAGAAFILVIGVAFFWNRLFPAETLEESPAGEEANKGDDEKAAPDGQVAQGSVAPPPGAPGQGQPVVPEGQPPAAVGVPADPAAVPGDPNAAPTDPNAAPVDPNAAVPADPGAVPAAAVTPAVPLAGDAVAILDEARGLYQKGGKKRLGEAKEKLEGILGSAPNNADALLLMAQVQLELGEMEASLETATKCTAVAPQTADCWLSIGVLKQNAKDDAAAIAAFERYLALAPEGAYASQVKKQLSRLQ